YLLAQRRNLLVEPPNLGLRHREPLAIRAIKLPEVAVDAFVDLLQAPLHFGLGEVPVPRVDRFKLAAVDRNARIAKEIDAPAKQHKLTVDVADRVLGVLAKFGYRLELRGEGARWPHELDVAL